MIDSKARWLRRIAVAALSLTAASAALADTFTVGGGSAATFAAIGKPGFLRISGEGEGGLLHGNNKLPEWLNVGGEFRALAFKRDTKVYKSKGVIPMQAELQAGVTPATGITAVAAVGSYDKDVEPRTFYVMGNVGDHVFARIGKFFPAFGILRPEHNIATRKGLGLNQGQESLNAEAGYVAEWGEVVVDAILGHPGEISAEEKGTSFRAAYYAGGKSQIGVSYMQQKGTVWDRAVPGVFVTSGLTSSTYILTELDQETKKAVERDDPSTVDNTRWVSATKLGWEFVRGAHVFATYESSVTTKGEYDPRLWSAGPGLQWFPRPHFEILAQAERRLDRTWSDQPGQLLTLMLHYNL